MTDFPILYSRTSKGAINTWRTWCVGNSVFCEWGALNGKMQISEFVTLGKNIGKSNETTPEEQAVKEAEALVEKQLRKKYSPTLEAAAESEAISPMLAKSFTDRKDKVVWPAFGQVKLDGLRCLSHLVDGKVVLQSRGNKFYTLPHIQNQLESILRPGVVLDGELYTHGISLQTINSYVRGQKPECNVIEYHVYDVVSDKPFSGRLNDLNELATCDGAPSVKVVETVKLNSEEEAIAFQAQCVADGYEGAMIRSAAGLYRYGYRSPDLLKMKTWQTEEFPIMGHKVGKGRFEEVPMIICGLPNGETFDVTPTGTMAERKELLDNIDKHIGSLYTVKFFDYSPYGKPLYPSGVSLRDESDL